MFVPAQANLDGMPRHFEATLYPSSDIFRGLRTAPFIAGRESGILDRPVPHCSGCDCQFSVVGRSTTPDGA
jgi:hypothetical protein